MITAISNHKMINQKKSQNPTFKAEVKIMPELQRTLEHTLTDFYQKATPGQKTRYFQEAFDPAKIIQAYKATIEKVTAKIKGTIILSPSNHTQKGYVAKLSYQDKGKTHTTPMHLEPDNQLQVTDILPNHGRKDPMWMPALLTVAKLSEIMGQGKIGKERYKKNIFHPIFEKLDNDKNAGFLMHNK